MQPHEVKAIAKEIIQEIHEQKHEFWIDGETHYNEHAKIKSLTLEDIMALKEAATAFRSVRGHMLKASFFLTLLGAAVISVLAALGKIRIG